MEDFIVEGNAPTVPGSIAILRSISVDHKGGGLGTGLPFEPVDPKNWWGLPTTGGEDCLEVVEVKVSVRPKVSAVLSVLPALGHMKPIGGPEGQLLAVEGQGGMPRMASRPAVGVDLWEWARDIKGCLCTESRHLAWPWLILWAQTTEP